MMVFKGILGLREISLHFNFSYEIQSKAVFQCTYSWSPGCYNTLQIMLSNSFRLFPDFLDLSRKDKE